MLRELAGVEIAVEEHKRVEKMGEVTPAMYLGMDGTGVPMRPQQVAGRVGQQADGSAKTREAKLVTVWTAEPRDPGSVSYSAAIESAATPETSPQLSDFAERVLREASRRAFPEAPRQGVLGDGAAWIWNIATELLPQVAINGKGYVFRGPSSGVAGKVFQACAVALPPTLRAC